MAKVKFIELTLGNYTIHHGYNSSGSEHKELFSVEIPKQVIIPLDSVVYADNEHIVTRYIAGRLIYWEYHNGYEYLKNKLTKSTAKPF
ncbi:MAG: hypothetical protein JXB34_00030 [Bacteroidales bacterium]|nr:hypothetical protein [Bacteroidales bacterium]